MVGWLFLSLKGEWRPRCPWLYGEVLARGRRKCRSPLYSARRSIDDYSRHHGKTMSAKPQGSMPCDKASAREYLAVFYNELTLTLSAQTIVVCARSIVVISSSSIFAHIQPGLLLNN